MRIDFCMGIRHDYFVEEREIPVSDFIISGISSESRIDIVWTRSLLPTTRAWAYAIKSIDDFNSRVSKSFLPWYKNGKGPYDLDAENYTVHAKTPLLTSKELEDYNQRLSY